MELSCCRIRGTATLAGIRPLLFCSCIVACTRTRQICCLVARSTARFNSMNGHPTASSVLILLIQERRIEDNTFEHWPAKLYVTHFGKVDDNPGHVKMTLNGALCSLPGVDLLFPARRFGDLFLPEFLPPRRFGDGYAPVVRSVWCFMRVCEQVTHSVADSEVKRFAGRSQSHVPRPRRALVLSRLLRRGRGGRVRAATRRQKSD